MLKERYTHAELVARAQKWLSGSQRCSVVMTEYPTSYGEQPDAIGWRYDGKSILVEVKISRADFLRDKKKSWRKNHGTGMGQERYYLAPPGLIQKSELPKHWGLLEVHPKTIKRIACSTPSIQTVASSKTELRLLLSALRRPAYGSQKQMSDAGIFIS